MLPRRYSRFYYFIFYALLAATSSGTTQGMEQTTCRNLENNLPSTINHKINIKEIQNQIFEERVQNTLPFFKLHTSPYEFNSSPIFYSPTDTRIQLCQAELNNINGFCLTSWTPENESEIKSKTGEKLSIKRLFHYSAVMPSCNTITSVICYQSSFQDNKKLNYHFLYRYFDKYGNFLNQNLKHNLDYDPRALHPKNDYFVFVDQQGNLVKTCTKTGNIIQRFSNFLLKESANIRFDTAGNNFIIWSHHNNNLLIEILDALNGTKKICLELQGFPFSISSCALNTSCSQIAFAYQNIIGLINTTTKNYRIYKTRNADNTSISELSFSDNNSIVAAYHDGSIRFYKQP